MAADKAYDRSQPEAYIYTLRITAGRTTQSDAIFLSMHKSLVVGFTVLGQTDNFLIKVKFLVHFRGTFPS